jgi:hypothetical protein
MVEPGALAGDERQASGAGAEWAGGGAHADLALGWRREEVGARLVSGAGAEWGGGWWGGGVRADLTLGRRREEAGACSFFSYLGARWGSGARADLALVVTLVVLRKRNIGRPLSGKAVHGD